LNEKQSGTSVALKESKVSILLAMSPLSVEKLKMLLKALAPGGERVG